MRIYIFGNDGITLSREPPAAVGDGEIVVASNEELHAARLSGKRLLALWNALPDVEKRSKVGDRAALIATVRRLSLGAANPAEPQRPGNRGIFGSTSPALSEYRKHQVRLAGGGGFEPSYGEITAVAEGGITKNVGWRAAVPHPLGPIEIEVALVERGPPDWRPDHHERIDSVIRRFESGSPSQSVLVLWVL